ncbi:unnamed protein product [Caenorhabditis bovis]|uniref:Uncharacterized protein n=1 Tax=Caenorhabditis bovis TaxID=2654633 RepID=A0A8S1F9D1_9PELO|nr:unnamed protein product [Caenorhabditis bovis]
MWSLQQIIDIIKEYFYVGIPFVALLVIFIIMKYRSRREFHRTRALLREMRQNIVPIRGYSITELGFNRMPARYREPRVPSPPPETNDEMGPYITYGVHVPGCSDEESSDNENN